MSGKFACMSVVYNIAVPTTKELRRKRNER